MTEGGMDRLDAYEEDDCLLCVPAPHPNCEKYTIVEYLDREHIPLGEDAENHTVEIPVCVGHYEALDQYRRGKNVAEVERR